MELSPSREATSFAATQQILFNVWNPKVHYRVHKSPPLVPTLNQTSYSHDMLKMDAQWGCCTSMRDLDSTAVLSKWESLCDIRVIAIFFVLCGPTISYTASHGLCFFKERILLLFSRSDMPQNHSINFFVSSTVSLSSFTVKTSVTLAVWVRACLRHTFPLGSSVLSAFRSRV
jgi:hypothetical protein